ncbi:hypothetical protein NEMBOFW57_009682 [Staphylotrichum longicolle]|uniref:Uncharacterized protein n=1 Tax=Staphylotrichum longicolle TaxID=669026 RepID=A0AAD4HUY6_9PEZI|nr:hypothetical protein NEMBOFW57_009682 [Staphylotrichum longicolle]
MQRSMAEDVDPDEATPTDAWAAFLSARFSQRKELYRQFSAHEQDLVRKELRRIRYLRAYFEEHRLSPNDTSSLITLLDKSHAGWRESASRRCKDELRRSEQWYRSEHARVQQSTAFEDYIPELDAMDDSVDDDPAKTDYGDNGWIIAFKKNQGGVALEHGHCHREFPHQTISMQKLLYDREHTPLRRTADKTQLRYFHLEANNMKWVEGHKISFSLWGRNEPDPSAVHQAIRDHLTRVDSSTINSVYDLALVIIDECSKVFLDSTQPDLRPEVVDMFGSAISSISEKKMEAYERFGRDVKRMDTQDPLQTTEELLRKSLNIKFEWSVLMEAQNVIDQLQTMQAIFTQQIAVMGDFEKVLHGLSREPQDGLDKTVKRAAELVSDMKLRRDELVNLERRQAETRAQLRELLDIKQQQSGIIEAKAAIRRADETVIRGRSIVVFTRGVTLSEGPGKGAKQAESGGAIPVEAQISVN